MLRKIIIIFIFLCGAILWTYSQERVINLSLLKSNEIMLKRNKSIKISDLSITTAKEEKRKLNSFWYPNINTVGAFVHSSNSIKVEQSLSQLTTPLKDLVSGAFPNDNVINGILDEIGKQNFIVPLFKRNITTIDANIMWPIFTGGKRIYSSKIGNNLVNIAQIDKNSVISNLQSELVTAYFGVRLSKRVVEVRLETYNTLKLHYENALKLEQHGMLNKADRLFAQVSMDEAKREYQSSKKTLFVAQNVLKTLLQIDSTNIINPVSPLFINENVPNIEYFKNQLPSSNYLLKKMRHEHIVVENNLKINKSDYIPTISFIGKQNLYNHNLPKNLVPRSMIGLDFTWTFFDGLSREANIRKLSIQKNILQTATEKAKDDLFLAVDQLYSRIKDAQDNVTALNTTIEMSKELLRVRRRSFKEGMATSTDVIDAETLLSKVQIAYLMAYYQYDVSLASLLNVCGISEEFWVYSESGNTDDFIFNN